MKHPVSTLQYRRNRIVVLNIGHVQIHPVADFLQIGLVPRKQIVNHIHSSSAARQRPWSRR